MTASDVLVISAVILLGLFAVRQVRMYLFRRELFWEIDPIIEADKWEGYRRDRQRAWTARRRRGGESTFLPSRHAASVTLKYLSIVMRPWFVPWPRREHIVEVAVRIPPRTHMHMAREPLVTAVARYLGVTEGSLQVRESRGLLRGKTIHLVVL